jgi:multiple sugar transport system ATP-binding protein
MSDVLISNLVKTYPGNTERATDDISLEIADGEFMVLLGPSGCGKTTLLRMIAGLELPDDGSISIGSRDVTYLPAHKRGLSMVFQSYAVFPHRSVRDNIAFGLTMAKKDRPKSSARSSGRPSCCSWAATSTASPRSCPAASASGLP